MTSVIDAATGFVWIDCDDPADVALLEGELDIHELAFEDIRKAGQRTKLEHYGAHYHVAIHDCMLVDDHLSLTEVDLVFATAGCCRCAISGRPRCPFPWGRFAVGSSCSAASTAPATRACSSRRCSTSSVIARSTLPTQSTIGSDCSERVFGSDPRAQRDVPQAIFLLDKALLAFRQASAPLVEVVQSIRRLAFVSPFVKEQLRDVADHALRLNDRIAAQQHLVDGLLSADLALRSQATNEVMKKMTSWGAILLGSTLIAGIYGMNFRHIPELDWYLGYPFALGMMATLTVTLYVLCRRRG